MLGELPGAKGVLVTAGGQGCSYAFKAAGGKMDYTGLVPVLRVKVEDTTGAGDAFLGGFVASLVKARFPPHIHSTLQLTAVRTATSSLGCSRSTGGILLSV